MELEPNPITVKTKDVKWLTSQAFKTRKRECTILPTETVTFYNTFWFEGSRNEYRAVKLCEPDFTIDGNGTYAELIIGRSPWNSIVEGTTMKLEPGTAIIEQSIFCGKEMKLRIHLHPSNVARLLGK